MGAGRRTLTRGGEHRHRKANADERAANARSRRGGPAEPGPGGGARQRRVFCCGAGAASVGAVGVSFGAFFGQMR
ncbi:hypothetical protein HEK616_57070 [Streptomyces nigrescens]|uniref:Uncharacterized protein n=1 Tax=Streptomyces nigrescens TaxID=1920 RepID=A0ABM8A0R9_STRNI|nr:hypothetical protein HEK616_57070 [Streptomyces nigrescens]